MPNVCQVSLKTNCPIILDNLKILINFIKKYFYIICPNKDKKFFKKKSKKIMLKL